ncbi:MAG: hypothetical protein IT564_07425 [Rhodospirillales bacterium]|nr:hypothetical protein [Rhodospirillales bacterium]
MRRTHAREIFMLRVGRAPFWRVAAVAAIAIAAALALAILVSGLFLILLPVIAVSAIAARAFGRRMPPPSSPRSDIIETEYEVIEEKRDNEKPAPPSGDSTRAP